MAFHKFIIASVCCSLLLSACTSAAGLDPTGISSMVAFEAQRQESVRMQQQVFSPEKMEQMHQNAVRYCQSNPKEDFCKEVRSGEAQSQARGNRGLAPQRPGALSKEEALNREQETAAFCKKFPGNAGCPDNRPGRRGLVDDRPNMR